MKKIFEISKKGKSLKVSGASPEVVLNEFVLTEMDKANLPKKQIRKLVKVIENLKYFGSTKIFGVVIRRKF